MSTTRCHHCEGTRQLTESVACLDCEGTGDVCVICRKGPGECSASGCCGSPPPKCSDCGHLQVACNCKDKGIT